MNNKERILELCEKVVKNGSNFGVNCDGIFCDDCPLSSKDRIDGMRCTENNEATVKIAKEYIDKNKSYYKVKEIIKNISTFEIGTKFSLFGMDVLSIGENETIIFEGNMNNKLDLNLVLKIEYPKKEKIVTFDELKVGDIFVLRSNTIGMESFQCKVISLVKEGLFVIQCVENNSSNYDFLSSEDIDEMMSIILIEG